MGFPRQGERPVHVEREIAALRALKGEANIVTLLETHEEVWHIATCPPSA